MTMKQNREQNYKDVTLKSLKAQLRRLPEVEVPETLKAGLFDAIPEKAAKVAQEHQAGWRPQAWDFGVTAAAAVLIFALMFMVNYGLSVPSQLLLTEFNDTSLPYARCDQNNLLYDQNNTYIEKSLPGESKWPMINQNEPRY